MKISIDSGGNVSLDTSYDTSGIDTIQSKMTTILAQIKTFSPDQIRVMTTELNALYPTMVNFEQFMQEWEDVLEKVEI